MIGFLLEIISYFSQHIYFEISCSSIRIKKMQFTAGSPGNTLSQQIDFLDILSRPILCILNNRATLSSTTVPQKLYYFLSEQSGPGASFEDKVYFLSVFTQKGKYFNVLVKCSVCYEQKEFKYSLQKANKINSILFLGHEHKYE